MAKATPLLPFVDRILDGKLTTILTAWKAEGLSNEAVARRLHAEHDIDVTAETVRKWCIELEVPQAKAAS